MGDPTLPDEVGGNSIVVHIDSYGVEEPLVSKLPVLIELLKETRRVRLIKLFSLGDTTRSCALQLISITTGKVDINRCVDVPRVLIEDLVQS